MLACWHCERLASSAPAEKRTLVQIRVPIPVDDGRAACAARQAYATPRVRRAQKGSVVMYLISRYNMSCLRTVYSRMVFQERRAEVKRYLGPLLL